MELHGEMIVHARESCEGHFTKIDFPFDIIEINTNLRETLADLLRNLNHLLQILWTRYGPVFNPRISQILRHLFPCMYVIKIINGLSSPTSTLQFPIITDKVILCLAVNTCRQYTLSYDQLLSPMKTHLCYPSQSDFQPSHAV